MNAFERIVAAIALGLFRWLESRAESRHRAVDADMDRDRLRRAGARVREWMQSSSIGPRVESDPDRSRD